MSTPIAIFDVEGKREEEILVLMAWRSLGRNVRRYLRENLPRHRVVFVDNIDAIGGIRPEALYSWNNTIKIKRLYGENGLKKYRLSGTFIHELGHAVDKYIIGANKEARILKLFDPVPSDWRASPDYWKLPYESFCDWWVRMATGEELISHYESRRRYMPADKRKALVAIVTDTAETPTPTDDEIVDTEDN